MYVEHDVLIFWAAILPVVGNPIIYLTCVSDYRVNIAQAWKLITGKQVGLYMLFIDTSSRDVDYACYS